MFHRDLLAYRSMPDVGSSSIINFESPHKAIATLSFLLEPPDKYLAFVSFMSQMPTSLRIFSISADFCFESLLAPLKSWKILKCSIGVRRSKRISC